MSELEILKKRVQNVSASGGCVASRGVGDEK
jgi:hypothetical protein